MLSSRYIRLSDGAALDPRGKLSHFFDHAEVCVMCVICRCNHGHSILKDHLIASQVYYLLLSVPGLVKTYTACVLVFWAVHVFNSKATEVTWIVLIFCSEVEGPAAIPPFSVAGSSGPVTDASGSSDSRPAPKKRTPGGFARKLRSLFSSQ